MSVTLKTVSNIFKEKGYDNTYYKGMILELDNPFYVAPCITIMCDIEDFFLLVPHYFHDKLRFLGEKLDNTNKKITRIKPNKYDINTVVEFYNVYTEYVETLSTLANIICENPHTF